MQYGIFNWVLCWGKNSTIKGVHGSIGEKNGDVDDRLRKCIVFRFKMTIVLYLCNRISCSKEIFYILKYLEVKGQDVYIHILITKAS